MKLKKLSIWLLTAMICCILSACSTKTVQPAADFLFDDRAAEQTTVQKIAGYYILEQSYVKITENCYESKLINNGNTIYSAAITEVTESPLIGGGTEINLMLDINDGITLYLLQDGKLYNIDNVEMIPISQAEYDALQPTQPEQSTDAQEEEEPYFDWYETEYCTYQVYSDLYEINNLLAIGKKDEAQAMFDQKIIAVLDQKVADMINRREYFLAQNYVAMYQKVLGANSTLYGYGESYSFLKDHLDDTLQNPYAVNCSGINIIAQKYHHQIAVAADADADVISREDSLYKMNEYLLSINREVVTGLFQPSDGYCYFSDVVQNGESVYYFILNPYTKQVHGLPSNYYFYDGVQNISHNPNVQF